MQKSFFIYKSKIIIHAIRTTSPSAPVERIDSDWQIFILIAISHNRGLPVATEISDQIGDIRTDNQAIAVGIAG